MSNSWTNTFYSNERAAEHVNMVSDIDFIRLESALGIPFSIPLYKTGQWCFYAHYNYSINASSYLPTKKLELFDNSAIATDF